jgi:hypothetical protein
LNKKSLDALGKIFEAEIDRRLPYQSKAKIYKELERTGHVQFVEEILPVTKLCPWSIKISGWCLTHLGRYIYCYSCKYVDEE